MKKPNLGTLTTEEDRRDAVHVAIIPIMAGERLEPGTKVKLTSGEAFHTTRSNKVIGVVDPFLIAAVDQGETFWMLMSPGSVSDLRHSWNHPEIPEETSHDEGFDPDGCISMGCE